MIWVVAGTSDARELIAKLLDLNKTVIATTASKEGARLIEAGPGLTVVWGKMNAQEMPSFIREYQINMVIDASHPYAQEVSKNVVEASGKAGIDYVRYERPGTGDIQAELIGSYSEIADFLNKTTGNILLTIGSNNLTSFSGIDPDRLYVRVLPVISSIQKCLDLNITASHIIAAQGPFSSRFNRAILEEFSIAYLVTKDSGKQGGLTAKKEAAAELGVKLLLVERPVIEYPRVFSDIRALLESVFPENNS